MDMSKFTMPTAKEAWCWVCVAALVCAWPSRAWAEAPPTTDVRDADMRRAERFAARGFGAYREKDYATAVALYLQAYDAAPSADMLFNIARIYDGGLSDRELAIRYYREYIAAPDAEPARIAMASERVARLSVAEEAAAAPTAASAAVSATPPETSATAPATPGSSPSHGGVPLVRPRPTLTAREIDASTFATVPVTGAATWTPLRVGAIVAGTVGLVGIGLGAGFGVAALSDASTAREDCDGNICSSQRGVDATRAASESANIATVSFALGGTLLAAGVALLWLERGDTSARETAARIEWSPLASSSELGVACSGRW
jgi:tetratricopeptide (TPR) repeat protein